tara:strand:- start:4372 stop:5211 length:840 start_codon:yes stop_codon:yes gene_type:complete
MGSCLSPENQMHLGQRNFRRLAMTAVAICGFFVFWARAAEADQVTFEPGMPPRPLTTFDSAKAVARDAIYADRRIDIYCGCDWAPKANRSGGTIDAAGCGYVARKNAKRGEQLEWEHALPAWFFGHDRICWKKGNARCVTAAGKAYKGRTCCAKVDDDFRRIEADLHNLFPAVGEINGDRSNLPFGRVAGEPRAYGRCDFEINRNARRKDRVAEPPDGMRGDLARAALYMTDTYAVPLETAFRTLLQGWHRDDPPDDWERLRDARIEAAQGNRNPYVAR